MVDFPGCFAWYELLTTDVSEAKAFYNNVFGWEVEDASTPNLPYALFKAAKAPICGLMDLPEEGRRAGVKPTWMAYVAVADVDVTAARIKRLGGTVYVPPSKTNIGFISVVADPQMATFALVSALRVGRERPSESGKPGHVGWHELLADEWASSFAFYSDCFGWERAKDEIGQEDVYHTFSACGLTIGGIFTRHPTDPPPFWLLYFNVEDIDAAAERVKAAGGEVFLNPHELPGGISIARCADPQGAAFGLQGKQGHISKLAWSTEWSGFSSKGRLVSPKARSRPPESET